MFGGNVSIAYDVWEYGNNLARVVHYMDDLQTRSIPLPTPSITFL